MTGRTARLGANGRAISAVHPEESQMTTASTGLAAAGYQELAAAPRADPITPADRGHDEAHRPVSQRC
jgi:superfamily II DNA/RNA helicase